MASTSAFEKAYAKLNARQKQAVDTIYGPVIVIAGPGTGKTQMLALRVGNILQRATGTKPDEILALTFTESAVAALRTRLASFIGSAAYRVRIHTFHGFARSILELRSDLSPRVALGTQLDEVRAVALMEELLDAGTYTKIRNPKDPHRLARTLFHFIGKLKQEHYTPERYRTELEKEHENILTDPERIHLKGRFEGKEKGEYTRRRERVEKHIEVAHLFRAYEDALQRDSLYDYEDLIAEAIRGLENDEGFRAHVGERSQFVLADEHQDANPAQNRLLELITDFDGAPNLFIVGDEKQAIYRFQGASLETFLSIKEKYPDAKLISLDENYRSKENILRTAHDLIAPAPIQDASLRPVLTAVSGTGGVLEEITCDTPRDEYEAIIHKIKTLQKAGVAYEDIAIITRKNADVLALAEYVRRAGIPEDHESVDVGALAHPAILLFIAYIRALTNLADDALLARAFFMPGVPMPLAERMRILSIPREGVSLLEVMKREGTGDFREWVVRSERFVNEMHATPVVTWLVRLAQESGFLAGILALRENEDAYSAYEGLMEEAMLLAKAHPHATGIDFLKHLALIEKHEIKIARPKASRAGVVIMTAHRAKGLEFSHVIIAHATDEKWMRGKADEFSLLLEKEDDEHDVRRLFYVALTRAKESVLITHAKVTGEDRTQTPLRFLADVATHLTQTVSSPSKSVPVPYEARTILDPNFLKARLLSKGFSPTNFNGYVQSPWQYYFRSLLQLPDAPTPSMQFGTAIHAGLKAYVDALKRNEASVDVAIATFVREIGRMPLMPSDQREFIKSGTDALRTYLAQESATMAHVFESEFSIKTMLDVPGVGEVPLSGKLDRLDIRPDGSVLVIDYKTGKAKSENEIKGHTKSADGNYYRQLVFYALLLEKDGRYRMDEGALHFVEPNEKGICVIRHFRITKDEVVALESELVKAAQAIASGSAFTGVCDPETCDYCDLVHILFAS